MKRTFLYCLLLFLSAHISAQTIYTQEANTHRIMSYNVRNGIGLDNKTDLSRTAAAIALVAPDVVALQEIDSMTNRSGKVDVLKSLADMVKMHAVFGAAIDYDDGKYGIGILSREKPISSQNIALPGKEEKRTALIVEFKDYVLCNTHWSLTPADRLASADIINNVAKEYNKPVFLAGDLNAEPQSDEIKQLRQNWQVINDTKSPTYPADEPKENIDYIFAYTGKGVKYSSIRTNVIDNRVASDHRPLFADIRIATNNKQVMRTEPYLQNPSPEGITVMWLTNVPSRSWVEYGTDSTNMQRARTFVEGMQVANNTINRIRLDNLEPNTKYYYRAVSQEILRYQAYNKQFGDTVKTSLSSFTTWSNDAKDFTAIIFNDLHNHLGQFDKLHKLIKDVNYDFVIYNGDCLSDIYNEGVAVNTISHYNKGMQAHTKPAIYIRGNHEIRSAYSPLLWNLLEKKGGEHTYAAFNVGDTRFVLLDCGEDKPDDHWVYYDMNDFTQYRIDQAAFLNKEIASKEFKKAKKRVLIHHIPIFGKNMDEYNPCKELWESALAKGKFDISLNAHTHRFEHIATGTYGNSYPVVIGGGYDDKGATVMVLKKEGAKMSLKVISIAGNTLLTLDL